MEFVVGERLDEQLFTWAGEVRTDDDQQAALQAGHEAEIAQRKDWFVANVAPVPITVELTLTVQVHEYDDDTGAFQASLGERHRGSLARRPHGDAAWDLRWSDGASYWSDDQWDWAVSLPDHLTPRGLEALRQQLRSP